MSQQALDIIREVKAKRLTRLDLGNCGLTELPPEALECDWVEELILSSRWWEYDLEKKEVEWQYSPNKGETNNITFLPPIHPHLPLLKKLVISNNPISDLSPLTGLVNLQELYCFSTQVTDLSPLAGLVHLQELTCSSTQVSDLSPLSGLGNLQILSCRSTQVTDLSPIAGLVHLQQLYCSSTQVSDLSPLSGLGNLQILYCYSTQVTDLSPLAGLIHLQELYCDSTQVSDLSPLAGLAHLQQLNCDSTQVSDLSPLAGLGNLQKLNCDSTQVSNLSPLAGLVHLQELYCFSTQVSDLLPLAGLVHLQKLYCSYTQVSDLSPLAGLVNLQELDCSSTQVSDLPPLAGLGNLRKLYCFSTQVSDLSPLAELGNLQILYCFSTQVSNLSPLAGLIKKGIPVKWQDFSEHYNEDTTNWQQRPAILVKDCPLDKALTATIKKGPAAVLKYFNKPKVRLFEARVLVLGEPRAGKTTLRHKLKNTNAEMPKITESTKAFEIEVAPYTCKIEKDGEANKMTYHLWDFGGQDYYRLLHQLFVAEQSVYLIVTGTDANKHEEELDFWLETIQRLGRDKKGNYGPVILLQNPKNKREDLNFQDLKKRYPFWQQTDQFVVNLNAIGQDKPNAETRTFDKKELERFQHFKAYLEDSFCQIEHIGKEMPTEWAKIKKDLDKKKATNWITKEEFRTVCASKGIVKVDEQDDLLGIFRTLGFLFHYDTKALEGMVILDSEWVTDALYRVLDDKIVESNKGWFLESDVKTIWYEQKYRDRTQALLDLMSEFKLSYFNEASKRYIVPAKLPRDTEGLPDWDERNNVHLRLQYDWLPRAIATQLIVTLHEYLVPLPNGKQWIWRKGAVLDGRKDDLKDVQVRIQDFWKENRIDISARGESSESLIRTVLQKWREVNAPFEDKVVVTKIILCHCSVCEKAAEPHKFKYENVLNAKEMGKGLQCNESLQEFAAADILKGVFDESTVVLDAFQKKAGKQEGVFFELIAAGEVDKALEMMPNNRGTVDFKRRYANLKRDKTKNLLTYAEFDLEQSKIVEDMLTYWEQGLSPLRGGMMDERYGEMEMPDRREEGKFGNITVLNYGQLNMTKHSENIAFTQNMGLSKEDFEAIQQLITQLSTEKRAALQQEMAAMPVPTTEAEKTSVVTRVFDWLNQNSENIVVEVVSGVYYDVLKALLGVG